MAAIGKPSQTVGRGPAHKNDLDGVNRSTDVSDVVDDVAEDVEDEAFFQGWDEAEIEATEDDEEYEYDDDVEDEEEDEEEEVEDEEEEEEDDEIADLRRQIAELKAKKEGVEKSEEPEQPPRLRVTKEEVEEAMEDAEKMLELLNGVFQQGRETVLKSLPNLVTNTVSEQTTVYNEVGRFYKQNPKLVEHKKYVGYLTNEVQEEHPDWPVSQILSEAAVRAYKGLGIKVKAVKREDQRRKKRQEGTADGQKVKPAFAKKPRGAGNRVPRRDARTGVQKQIDDIIKRR